VLILGCQDAIIKELRMRRITLLCADWRPQKNNIMQML
jgi:hypothetical protein